MPHIQFPRLTLTGRLGRIDEIIDYGFVKMTSFALLRLFRRHSATSIRRGIVTPHHRLRPLLGMLLLLRRRGFLRLQLLLQMLLQLPKRQLFRRFGRMGGIVDVVDRVTILVAVSQDELMLRVVVGPHDGVDAKRENERLETG